MNLAPPTANKHALEIISLLRLHINQKNIQPRFICHINQSLPIREDTPILLSEVKTYKFHLIHTRLRIATT